MRVCRLCHYINSEYLLSYLRLTSLAQHARHRRKFARSVDDSRCADTRSVLRCSHPAPRNACDEASDVGSFRRRAALSPDLY